VVIELNSVVDPQLNKSKHDFTGQAILNNCKDKGKKLGRIAGSLYHQAGGGRMVLEKPHQHP